jgi:hypothetical protein
MLVTDPGIKASDAAAFRAAGMKILFGIPRSASTHTGRKHAGTGLQQLSHGEKHG